MGTISVTKDSFEREVLQADKPVLVDFWAKWCGPCQRLGPLIGLIADEHPEIKVCKVDIDREPELAMKYQVMHIPTLMVFKNGQVVNQSVGEQSREAIEGMF